MQRVTDVSPRVLARVAGLFYLLIFISAPKDASTATPAKMIVTLACDTGVAITLFFLLRPVSGPLSLLAASFRLAFVSVMAISSLDYFGLLNLFHSAHSSSAFDLAYGIALVPFGIHCLLVGRLICMSTFFPRILGVLMALAGLGYLTFLWPQLGSRLFFPYILVPALLGEGSLTLWLLIVGVKNRRHPSSRLASHR